MNDEESIFHPSVYPDVWADLARWIVEMEEEFEQAEQQIAFIEAAE